MPSLHERVAELRRTALAGRPLADDDLMVLLVNGVLETNWSPEDCWWFHLRRPPETPGRILLIQLASIGDVLYTTPALSPFRARHPGAKIDLLTETEAAALVTGHPALDEVLVFDRGGAREQLLTGQGDAALVSLAQLASRLRRNRYDWVVNLHTSPRSAALAAIAGGERADGVVLYDRCGVPLVRGHAGIQHAFWMRTVDGRRAALDPVLSNAWTLLVAEPEPRPTLVMTPGAQERARTLVGEAPLLGVVPGANYRTRQWPAERFREAAGRIAARFSLKPVVLGAADQRALCEAACPEGGVVVAGEPLPVAAALLARARLVLTNDTGPLHMAAAAGVPAVVLAGPNWVGPYGEGVILEAEDIPCRPCGRTECPAENAHACMTRISVEHAVAAAGTLLAGEPAAAAAGVRFLRPRPDRLPAQERFVTTPEPEWTAEMIRGWLERQEALEICRDLNRHLGIEEPDGLEKLARAARRRAAAEAKRAVGMLAPPAVDLINAIGNRIGGPQPGVHEGEKLLSWLHERAQARVKSARRRLRE